MDIDSFIVNIKIENESVYEGSSNDIEKRFDTSNEEIERLFPTGKNENVIGLMKY